MTTEHSRETLARRAIHYWALYQRTRFADYLIASSTFFQSYRKADGEFHQAEESEVRNEVQRVIACDCATFSTAVTH